MWFINVIWSIPTLLLVFALTLLLGKGFWQVFIAVGLTMWVNVARLVRGQVMAVRELEYIEATRALGYSHARTIVFHILPNILGPVMVIAASNFASAIVIEAGLSFLGVGVQPPQPSWGLMIKENYNFIITNNPMLALAPGIAIMILVLAFNLLGNGLRDALNVRGKLVIPNLQPCREYTVCHNNISVKTFFQRNKSFCSFYSFYFLQFIVQYMPQLVNVFTYNFCKHAVVAGSII